MKTYIVTGAGLSIDDVVNVARNHQKVSIHPEALAKMSSCREMVERKIDAGEIMYGVNTGIGEFSETVLNDEQVKEFQKYLIYNLWNTLGLLCWGELMSMPMATPAAVRLLLKL